MEDDEFTVYDIEMQTYKEADLPKRTRYYQGMIDLNMMGRGERFRELKRSYLVFICLRNPFKEDGYHKYEFCNMSRQNPPILLGDEAYKIVLSAEGDRDDVSGDMKEFLRYLPTRQTGSDLTRKLDERVKEARAQKKWRLEYMTLLERDEQKREEGRAEGRAEGEKIFGELVKKLMADGLLEEIEKVTGDMEYRHSLYEKYGLKQ